MEELQEKTMTLQNGSCSTAVHGYSSSILAQSIEMHDCVVSSCKRHKAGIYHYRATSNNPVTLESR